MPKKTIDYKVPDGKLIRIDADLLGGEISKISITGDFFMHPEDGIKKLEAAVSGKEPKDAPEIVSRVLGDYDILGAKPEDFSKALMSL